MSAVPPVRPADKGADPRFEVSLERAPKPGAPVVEGEADGAEGQRDLDAALASTYDPAKVHDGKTDDELIAEREHRIETEVDIALVAGAVLAAEIALPPDHSVDDPTPPPHDGEFP